jgi:tetratricopeptide (TPR) repeat protein
MAEVLELIGKTHLKLKRYEEAIPWFQKGIEHGFPDANCNLAVTLLSLNRFKDALEPGLFVCLFVLFVFLLFCVIARVCAHHGSMSHRLHDAGARNNAGLKMTNYALCLKNLNRTEEAIIALDDALKIDPASAATIAELRKTFS